MNNKRLSPIMIFLASLCFIIFLVYGMYFNSFGVNASSSMAFFNITASKQGMIITIQSIGCFFMTILLGLYGERLNKLKGIAIGCTVMSIAAICIGTIPAYTAQGNGYSLILVYALFGGLGYIMIDLLMNGVISDVFPEHKHTLLPFVHAFYGTGAMLAPILVSNLANPNIPSSFAKPFLILGLVSAVLVILFIVVSKRIMPSTIYADMTDLKQRAVSNPAEIFKEKLAWLFLLTSFLHVSFQNGLSSWLTKYCCDAIGLSYENAALMLTIFFAGNLAMRFLSPLIYKIIPIKRYYCIFMLIAAGLFLLFILADIPLILRFVLIFLLGLMQGGGVPSIVVLCCDAFPARTASASSLFVIGVSLATFITPTLMGKMIETIGYTTPMLMITVFLVLSVVVLSFSSRYQK